MERAGGHTICKKKLSNPPICLSVVECHFDSVQVLCLTSEKVKLLKQARTKTNLKKVVCEEKLSREAWFT